MTNKVKKYRVELYDQNELLLMYELFDTEEEAVRFIEAARNARATVSKEIRTRFFLRYAGAVEVNILCTKY